LLAEKQLILKRLNAIQIPPSRENTRHILGYPLHRQTGRVPEGEWGVTGWAESAPLF
jgi:hypothetical protein